MRIDFAEVLPMFGVDLYYAGHGRMRGTLLGMITVADGSGAIRSRRTDDLRQRRAHARALDAPHTSDHVAGG
jgi:hypothetical protein